jgi:hypothetical protein
MYKVFVLFLNLYARGDTNSYLKQSWLFILCHFFSISFFVQLKVLPIASKISLRTLASLYYLDNIANIALP